MKALLLLAWIVFAILIPTGSSADVRCEPLLSQRHAGAGLLEQCGDQLRSYVLKPTDPRWREDYQYHVGFWFDCLTKPSEQELGLLSGFPEYVETQRKPCVDEPQISGAFVWPDESNSAAQEEATILQSALSRWKGPLPAAVCPIFDLSLGNVPGRATCVKEGKTSAIIARFTDGQVAFVLIFSQQDKPLDALKDKARMILSSQFTVERGTGDAALMRWIK